MPFMMQNYRKFCNLYESGKEEMIRSKGILVSIIVFILFNIVSFVIPFSRTATFWTGYMFAMIALVVLTETCFKLNTVNKPLRSRFYGWPIIYIAVGYVIIQLIVSLFFMGIHGIPVWVAVLVCSCLTGIALIGILSVSMATDAIETMDAHVQKKVFYIKSLDADVAEMIDLCLDSDTKRMLMELRESIRYSDPMSHESLAPLEQEILLFCDNLHKAMQERRFEDARSTCTQLALMIQKRNAKCKLLK